METVEIIPATMQWQLSQEGVIQVCALLVDKLNMICFPMQPDVIMYILQTYGGA